MEFHYVDLGNIVLLDPPPRFQEFGDALKRLKIKGIQLMFTKLTIKVDRLIPAK